MTIVVMVLQIYFILVVFLPRRGSNNHTGKPDKISGSLEKDNSFILTGILIDNTDVY